VLIHSFSLLLLVLLLSSGLPCRAQAPSAEIGVESEVEKMCGPGIVTIGDAWEFITLERQRAGRLISSGELAEWPQRIAALAAHGRFIESKAYFLFGQAQAALSREVAALHEARMTSSALALAGERGKLAGQWPRIEARMEAIAKLLPAETLVPTSKLAHLLPPSFSTTALSLSEPLTLQAGVEQRLRFKAERWLTKGRPLLLPEHLMELHGQRMHAFVADLTLADYHHLHPQPTDVAGVYELRFIPKVSGHYRLWVNQVPLETGREEFPHLDLRKPESYPIVKEEHRILAREAVAEGLRVRLSFPDALTALRPGNLYMGRLEFEDAAGQPVRDLEPFMGAFAHLVTLAEDYYTIQHLHPHGAVPQADQRGGPVVEFPYKPLLPCWWKLWVQVKHHGQIITLPLGVKVEWPQ